ncbi:MAG: hypothetical protein BM555_03850 [Crocinitomix sp. MedPE-SWsnd]|nr:MAG: hypothetical protein BM555_03850 [Crocinitomix sp. MedPE-SWsnd]
MKSILLTFSIVLTSLSFGQQGGLHTFQFLDLDFNSRSMALGGDFIALKDGDIDLSVANPASITSSMDNKISLNHFVYPSGINYGQLAYAKNFEKVGTFVGHLRYVNYGKFTRTDETGTEQGSFTAGDYALGAGYSHELNKYFSIGANFNMLFSHYETYTSFGVGVDMATIFHDEKSNITASLIARNIGYQIKGFTKSNHEALPIEVLAGISYKFHHAPFRLSLMGTDLTNWDLTYNDPTLVPTVDQLTGDTIAVPRASFVTKLAYHTNFGVEILPNENFFIRAGFNFGRRNGLGVENRKGASGISFGLGLKTTNFVFNYGISFYSAAGISNSFGITYQVGGKRTKRKTAQKE